ncbi:hypothetical protein [Pseudomonas oryzihabitans]|uniref:hypothetical protein n=1 Tax=Pseudomonas oryzihabitans TaxID=47885 RepID=UPI0011A5CA69|nr:hypothetical protein [Pseudomonas oryzihabitans]
MTRALIGTDPDQVPLNRHLGDLSRMNGDELAQQIGNAMSQRLAGTGLGAVNDLRNTVFERGAPADVFGTGMTVGLARAGSDGVGVPGIGTGEFGALIINAQWSDSSIGPAYSRQFFRSGRMWFQAMKSATAWDTWAEVLTSGAKAVAALSTIGSVAADQVAFFTGTGTAGTTSLSPLARTLIANTDLSSMLSTLGLVGLGTYADLRGNTYEKGTPNSVLGKGTMVGLARGGSDGLGIPAFGSTGNQYGTLVIYSGWNDTSGGQALNRMFLRNGRMWVQPFASGTAWGAWSEVYTQQSILGTVSQSGGVATGAIIERGSNSNGEYTRWADGTQECFLTLDLSMAFNNPFGNGYYAVYKWTYPAAFAGPNPAVTFTAKPGGNLALPGLGNDPGVSILTNVDLLPWTWNSYTANTRLCARAVGRWYA